MMTGIQPSVVSVSDLNTLTDLLRFRASHQPERLAYIFLKDGESDDVCFTYAELDRRARVIGAQLQCLGATGERVLLLYPAGLEYVAAFFGCMYAGAVAVPVYPPRFNRSIERLEAIVADAQATVALTTTSMRSKVTSWQDQTHLTSLQWLNTDQLSDDLADAWHDQMIEADTLAFLQYTSGSTGTPKGVMLSHGNLLYNLGMIQQSFGNTSASVGVSWLPLYHDMGLIGSLLHPLHVGFRCVMMSPMAFLQRPFRWLKAISRYRATGSGAPNFAYDLCLRKITPEQKATLDLSSWTLAFSGAEPVRRETLDRFAATFAPCGFRREAFHPCYGLAEATLIVSGSRTRRPPVIRTVKQMALGQHQVMTAKQGDDDCRTLVSCGNALLEEQIVVVDPTSRSRCKPGEVGEIWVAGPSVAQGYWNQPEETDRTFRAYLADTGDGPFLRTGDLGFLHHGELFITGRLKEVIIIRGHNHYPQDIESTIEKCHHLFRPGCGAAFSVDLGGEERLVVAQEVERCHRLASSMSESRPESFPLDSVVVTVRQAIAEKHGLQVAAILLLRSGSLPKTSSGKIQRYACRTGFLGQTLQVVAKWQLPMETRCDSRTLPANLIEVSQYRRPSHGPIPELGRRRIA